MRSSFASLYLSDIGNTNVKIWRDGDIEIFPLSDFQPTIIKEKIYFISVNREFSKRVEKLSNWIDISNLFKVETEYKTLGIDRVVAINNLKNGIVVDVGSAVTVDIVKNSKHLGGYILLGKDATFRAFRDKAPHLKIENRDLLNLETTPLFSEDAIYYGFFHSIANLVLSLQKRYSIDNITVTGGDGKELHQILKGSIFKRELLFENIIDELKKDNII